MHIFRQIEISPRDFQFERNKVGDGVDPGIGPGRPGSTLQPICVVIAEMSEIVIDEQFDEHFFDGLSHGILLDLKAMIFSPVISKGYGHSLSEIVPGLR